MQQIVECVPNFSNGRDPSIYNNIADAIRSVRGVTVLDISPDRDHNRTVITFVGTPGVVEEAAFRAISRAAELINLDEHQGEHPRLGATDVVPFIPVKNVDMAACVDIARRLGERVGSELGIAVYLYGEAAIRPEREKLSSIRRGQYERWKEEVGSDPERQPDFGPAEPRSWGATVIGARPFLIAYNIYLNTDNVEVAERIARVVRFSSGGLRHVQAKGFLVEGQAQVSMNLTNFEKTAVHHVQEMVAREAARYGYAVTKAELIGMTPQKALMEAARYYLQLDDLEEEQILEVQLAAQRQDVLVPESLLEATAAPTATPGGGAIAALAGALAAALTQMVAGLTSGRRKYADVEEQANKIAAEAEALREELSNAVEDDVAAFSAVMDAYRDKEADEASRRRAIDAATLRAAHVPLHVAQLSHQVATLASQIAEVGNVNASTDAAAAVLMAQAAVRVAALNVKVNVVNLQDQTEGQALRQEVEALEEQVNALGETVAQTAAKRGGF